ncbi:MAG: hypothetical protein QUS09_05500 [Methanotrichaceae archaeon]|nr:hypothetical protein [Methanotrichaceae archaeon]
MRFVYSDLDTSLWHQKASELTAHEAFRRLGRVHSLGRHVLIRRCEDPHDGPPDRALLGPTATTSDGWLPEEASCSRGYGQIKGG